MRKTKIVCTIGPSTRQKSEIVNLVKAGMNVARLNFSHGTKRAHKKSIQHIRKASREQNQPVAILQDLAGPKIRIGDIENAPIILKPGQKYILTNRNVTGNKEQVSLNYEKLPEDVKPGDTLLLADGALEMEVVDTDKTDIECKVIVGGELSSKKGINLPDTVISTKTLTEKDCKDLDFGLENDVDYVALSFVRSAADVQEVRDIIDKSDNQADLIAKIEKNEALKEIDEILEVVDGIMIARGDLGVEIPIERVPGIQKRLTEKAKSKGKIVITATQMLKSMVDNP
ncbi:MAG TPA: pyruvate kinase, partial [bacterium]|nr:pyruvate kinase [bacterium]